jgi:hypothetical protein
MANLHGFETADAAIVTVERSALMVRQRGAMNAASPNPDAVRRTCRAGVSRRCRLDEDLLGKAAGCPVGAD